MLTLKTIDAHAAGEPLRLIVDGFPSPRGKTMLEKRESVRRYADHLRRALMLEPRGHADMYGAILTEPVLGSVVAYFVLREAITRGVLLGFLTISAGVLVLFLPALAKGRARR